MNETKTITKRVLCSARAAQVFEALHNDETVSEWMTADAEIDPNVGGTVRIAIAGWPDVLGHIVTLEPPHLLELVWQASDWTTPSRLRVELRESDDDCWVTIEESGFARDPEVFAQRDALWSHWLIRLAAVVVGR